MIFEKYYSEIISILEKIKTTQKEKIEKENKVIIEKNENGYTVKCSISGGDIELMSVSMHLADVEQARTVKKNFYKNPQLFYRVMLAAMTRNKGLINLKTISSLYSSLVTSEL